jgi:hypothetical protein
VFWEAVLCWREAWDGVFDGLCEASDHSLLFLRVWHFGVVQVVGAQDVCAVVSSEPFVQFHLQVDRTLELFMESEPCVEGVFF